MKIQEKRKRKNLENEDAPLHGINPLPLMPVSLYLYIADDHIHERTQVPLLIKLFSDYLIFVIDSAISQFHFWIVIIEFDRLAILNHLACCGFRSAFRRCNSDGKFREPGKCLNLWAELMF